jgi:HSP20 family protein
MYLRQLHELQHQMDELFTVLSGARRPVGERFWRTARLFPLLNVKQTSEAYEVTAEIPGMKTEDLEINVEGDTLTLKGERKPVDIEDDASYHRRERATGTFQRSITLPGKVDAAHVKATYKNGVLTVTLPLEKSALPKQIAITAE